MKQETKNAQDLFTYIPSEIISDILLRIPTRTIMSCKCVCKAWNDLLKTPEFVKSHLSSSVPGLAVYVSSENSTRYKIVEFVDEHRLNVVFSFDVPFISGHSIVHSSANGLLFVCNQYDNPLDQSIKSHDLFICNLITRELIRLPSPLEPSPRHTSYRVVNFGIGTSCDEVSYGFGVSKMSGQYKVIRIRINLDAVDCQVYTIGTGSWRRINTFDNQFKYSKKDWTFLNGNLHLLTSSYAQVSRLDLETETFSTFSSPPTPYLAFNSALSVLGDCLCICYSFYDGLLDHRIHIWLMKEYGEEKSWTNEVMILSNYSRSIHCPVKVLKDGDILMEWGGQKLLYYSNKTKTMQLVDMSEDNPNIVSPRFGCLKTLTTVYAPSFLPLKTFTMENVSSF